METTKTIKYSFQYGRVSTPDQLKNGDSLEDQEKVTENEALKRGISPLKFYGDTISGSTISRDGYDEMLADIDKSNKKIQTIFYVIIKCIDRWTRGGAEFYLQMKNDLKKRNVQLVDVTGIIQEERNSLEDKGFEYTWSKYSPSETNEIYEAQKGKDEKRAILTRTIGQQISLTQKGFRMGSPLDGMKSEVQIIDSKERVVFVKNLERVHFIEKMFDMRASGVHSDQEIVDTVNAMGYKSPIRNRWDKKTKKHIGTTGGEPLTIRRMLDLITNVGYCGISVHKWNKYIAIDGKIEEIVSIETFNKANRGKVYILKGIDGKYDIRQNYKPKLSRQKLRQNTLFPYAKVFVCELCGYSLKYGMVRGKNKKVAHPHYFCNYKKHKYVGGMNKKDLENNFEDFLKSLSLTNSFLDILQRELVDVFMKRSGELKGKAAEIHINIADLKTEQEKYIQEYVNTQNAIIKKSLESKINELEERVNSATGVREKNEVEELNMDEFIKYTRNFMNCPATLILDEKDNPETVGVLCSLIFEEKPTYSQILNRTPKLTSIFNTFSEIKEDKNRLGYYTVEELNTLIKSINHTGYILSEIYKKQLMNIGGIG